MPELIIPVTSEAQLAHLFKAEEELNEAGVTFDTGSDLADGKVLNRVWSLDWSLEGATVKDAK